MLFIIQMLFLLAGCPYQNHLKRGNRCTKRCCISVVVINCPALLNIEAGGGNMIENKYCKCGEPINVEHNARRTFRTDGLRFFPPSDLIPGLCHFRCPACKEVVEYDRLVELGNLPIRPPADSAVEPVNSLQQPQGEKPKYTWHESGSSPLL